MTRTGAFGGSMSAVYMLFGFASHDVVCDELNDCAWNVDL